MAKMDYYGWGNYETWLVSTWIHGDQLEIGRWTEEARIWGNGAYGLAQRLKDRYQEKCKSQVGPNGLFSDLIRHALDRVDWYKISRSLLDPKG